jgi:ATP-dependent DNA helicase RecG
MDFIENTTTELKREYIDDIKKTIIAFANTSGGSLYIGVNNDGSVFGVDDLDGTMLKISNTIRDSIKPDITLYASCEPLKMDSSMIIKITVQKGTACPYYLSGKGIRPEGVFVRQGASTVPASETTIRKMLKETDGEKYETIRSLNQDLTFIEAENEFHLRNVPFGENQFKSLKLMTTDGVYTNLGLLLSDQCVHNIKLAVFEGTNKSVFKDRRELQGSLLKQLNDAYAFIDMHNGTHAEISGLYRTDKRDYPVAAVREALLNALVHREYSFSGSTLISIFDDHLEFISIGGLVKGITFDDIMLGISVTRNENLANIFYRLSLIEAYGTGMPKITSSYENASAKPKIEVSDNAFKITLPNINSNTISESAHVTITYDKEDQSILDLFKGKTFICRKDVEAALQISQTKAGRLLKGLADAGVIGVSGSGKSTKYFLVK